MAKYAELDKAIDAIQFTGKNAARIKATLTGKVFESTFGNGEPVLFIKRFGARDSDFVQVLVTDWIVVSPEWGLSIQTSDEFAKVYRRIEE